MNASDFAIVALVVLCFSASVVLLVGILLKKNGRSARAFNAKLDRSAQKLTGKLQREIAAVQFLGYRDAWRSGIGGGILGGLIAGKTGAILGSLLSGGRKRSRLVFSVRYSSGDTKIRELRANSRECRELLDFISKNKAK